MKIVNVILIAAVALLSIGAGAAKFLQIPQEINFLQGAGLSLFQIMVLGAFQTLGGLLILLRRTRVAGCVLIALALLISAVFIFIAGDIQSGAFSLFALLLVCIVAYRSIRASGGSKQ